MEALIESAKLAGLIAGVLFALAAVAKFGDSYADWRYHRNLTPVETEHDRDCWFEPALPFTRSRFESRTRSRLVIAARCGADPEKSESRGVSAPGSLTSKEFDHAGTSK